MSSPSRVVVRDERSGDEVLHTVDHRRSARVAAVVRVRRLRVTWERRTGGADAVGQHFANADPLTLRVMSVGSLDDVLKRKLLLRRGTYRVIPSGDLYGEGWRVIRRRGWGPRGAALGLG